MTPSERTRIGQGFRNALEYWAAAGYSAKLSEMTMWLRGHISHHLAPRLTREDVANLLHRAGWGPDDNNHWQPNKKLPHVKRYVVKPDGQLSIVRLRER